MSEAFSLIAWIEHEVDVADDGRGVGLGFEVRRIGAVAADFELAEDVLHRLALAAVALVDHFLDEVVRRDDDDDFAAEGEAQVLERLRVERIDQGDVQAVFVEIDGKRAVQAGGAGGNQREQRLGRRRVR